MIKVAIIGSGNMAKEHLKAFTAIDGVIVVGIYSRTKEKCSEIAKQYPSIQVYDSISDLYLQDKPDLVVIAVSELSTELVCMEAFKFPWTCLIEKPVGYNLEVAARILAEAQKHKIKAYVALNRRHYCSTIKVLEQLAGSNEVRVVRVNDQEGPKAALDSGQPALIVENWMYANSIHLIDYFTFLCRGSVISVDHVVSWNPQNPFYVCAKITYDSGDIGIYEAFWDAPAPWSVIINTPSKRWELRPLEFAFLQNYGSRKQEEIELNPLDKEFKPGLMVQAQEALKAVKGMPNNLPYLDQFFKSMELTKKIYFDIEK
jgi:predicted dehydrogenase